MALLLGESVAGEYMGDWGMRSRRSEVGVRAEMDGRTTGDGGIMGADDGLWASWLHEQVLPALDGTEVGVDLPDLSQNVELLPVEGLDTAGERALRNSV